MFSFLAHILTMPTNSDTTVVLLRNELRAATGSIRRTTALPYELGVPSR